ncbi:MAG TPA: hypothetical protein VFA10_25310 [Ktedonobacteraceae bacterium]|jgi:hypothetical protein|nr:hypothetical protein [Ktedonobacteraceae bacterium]
MSLKPMPMPPVPEETARVAHAVFPRGNILMQLRDTLGTIYPDEAFRRRTLSCRYKYRSALRFQQPPT